jgi:two-component system, sensor histidine kinase FlrB
MPILPSHRQEGSGSIREAAPDGKTLAEAFEFFTRAAGTLESSYTVLQGEVARLRRELEIKNGDLAVSLAENRKTRAYLAGLLEDLPSGVLVVDRAFSLRFANPHARNLLSLTSENAPAPPKSLPETLRTILREISIDREREERTWKLEGRGGDRYVAVACALRTQAFGARDETVFILRDVTEQRRLEEEREASQRMRALAEMTALLAHEIRNPLGSLELFAGLVKEATQDQAEVSQWVVHMQAGLRALSATVNNVLHFHSAGPPQLVPIDLVGLLGSTIEFLQPLALQRGMGIEFTPHAPEILIAGDAHRLQQVFFNLAMNAFRAMPAGKRLKIFVEAEELEQRWRARVDFEDEGIGIPARNLKKIFEPGFSTIKSSPGLGLAVCRRLTAQHGGTIRVSSSEGRGTTFSLYLPKL